jgi:hypothetical protein
MMAHINPKSRSTPRITDAWAATNAFRNTAFGKQIQLFFKQMFIVLQFIARPRVAFGKGSRPPITLAPNHFDPHSL